MSDMITHTDAGLARWMIVHGMRAMPLARRADLDPGWRQHAISCCVSRVTAHLPSTPLMISIRGAQEAKYKSACVQARHLARQLRQLHSMLGNCLSVRVYQSCLRQG